MSRGKTIDWRLFGGLLIASVLAQLAALPYVFSLLDVKDLSLPVPLPVAVVVQAVQGAVLSAAAILLGALMARRFGLGMPLLEGWLDGRVDGARLARVTVLAAVLGGLAGAAIFLLDRVAFALLVEPITPYQATPPLWQRFLVCFYGGINEEIYLRLFLMTLLLWLGAKLTRRAVPTPAGIWVAIVAVSVIFGLGHLPMTAKFMPVTPIVVVRGIVLNGVAGVLFGWLYWRRGLGAAIIAHFSTDVVLHVALPLLA